MNNNDYVQICDLMGDVRFLEAASAVAHCQGAPDVIKFRQEMEKLIGKKKLAEVYKDNNYRIKDIMEFFTKG